jgi:hypothetical protein
LAGKNLRGDAYTLDGWERSLAKTATNTLINARNELSALRSIAQGIGGKGAYDVGRSLIAEIKAKHAEVAEHFGNSKGLELMRIDSDMAESVMLKLIQRGIVPLPVHDSFLVEERHAGVLDDIMTEVLDLALRRDVFDKCRTVTGYAKNVPQYGYTPSLSNGADQSEPANCNLFKTVGMSSMGSLEADSLDQTPKRDAA